ncbi:cytochrome p450 [Trifolium pratense]|uniref:Cytochrome p450 n=1 Tax=Trifolium pratense TaxID=57577 RepID=A0A2K3LBG8_TRIPR|nr:cytochrome p450 [Trifolium pratense]
MTHTLEYSANVSPPKAKHLLSRICKDCLPTRTRLRNHFVQCQEECPLCSQVPEEEWHLLVECEGSREAWSVMGLEQILTPRLQSCNNIQELIFDICCREKFPLDKQVNNSMLLTLMSNGSPQDMDGYLKCNVDASFLATTNATGSGWCFRDNQGRFLLAGSNVIHGRLNTIEGEAVAMKEAISEAIQRGFTHVIFESDSRILIDAISSRQQGYSTFSLS